jgi:hypothetical protein
MLVKELKLIAKVHGEYNIKKSTYFLSAAPTLQPA